MAAKTPESRWDSIDYFSDPALVDDPYGYYEELREQGPIVALPHLGVVAVTGYDEAVDVYRRTEDFSSCNSVVGPFAIFPVPLEGDDVGEIIDRHRDGLPMYEHMVTMDPPMHTRERALLMKLLTPRRLKENEAFMRRLADRELDALAARGTCEFIASYAQPFAMLAVADVLGVPETDHERFKQGFNLAGRPGGVGPDDTDTSDLNALSWLDDCFAEYIEDRRRSPRRDVLTDLATTTYPDGSVPEVVSVVRSATFLFAAGQETTARLLATALKHLAEHSELQGILRERKDLIGNFIEEALRMESPVKADFRLARRTTRVGDIEIRAGTPVMLLNGAANRDPRRFDEPHEFRIDRPNAQAHIAFGRGAHSCPGGPLARAEGRISLERILDRLRNIQLDEAQHGPPSARRFTYEPTWMLRGLNALHLEFEPA